MKKIVIGLTGLAGAGKSTAARILSEESGFCVLPFAAPLKRIALDLGFTQTEISTGKESPFDWFSLPAKLDPKIARRAITRIVPLGWSYGEGAFEHRPCLGYKTITEATDDLRAWYEADRPNWKAPRVFLQRLGTEWGRERIHPEIWVEAWRNSLAESVVEHFGDILAVADDCRFENEATAIRKEGGIVVRVVRDGAGSVTGAGHASESGVEADITIRNDGPEEVLRARIFGVLDRHFQQIPA